MTKYFLTTILCTLPLWGEADRTMGEHIVEGTLSAAEAAVAMAGAGALVEAGNIPLAIAGVAIAGKCASEAVQEFRAAWD
jgi:hypothetical protein